MEAQGSRINWGGDPSVEVFFRVIFTHRMQRDINGQNKIGSLVFRCHLGRKPLMLAVIILTAPVGGVVMCRGTTKPCGNFYPRVVGDETLAI